MNASANLTSTARSTLTLRRCEMALTNDEDVIEIFTLIKEWHESKINTLKKVLDTPADTTIVLEVKGEEGSITLNAEQAAGYRAALLFTLERYAIPNHIAAGQRRTLRAMREKLLRMATAWEGISGALENELVQLANQVEAQAMRMVSDPPDDDSIYHPTF